MNSPDGPRLLGLSPGPAGPSSDGLELDEDLLGELDGDLAGGGGEGERALGGEGDLTGAGGDGDLALGGEGDLTGAGTGALRGRSSGLTGDLASGSLAAVAGGGPEGGGDLTGDLARDLGGLEGMGA